MTFSFTLTSPKTGKAVVVYEADNLVKAMEEALRIIKEDFAGTLSVEDRVTVSVVKSALDPEQIQTTKSPPFPVWKTIKLGTGLKTSSDFYSSLEQSKMLVGDLANDILGKPTFTVSERRTYVDLVSVSVADLGFKDEAYRRDIHARALSLGLELCPAEVGPQLRLQYVDQPSGECLTIGMEAIIDSYDDPTIFTVGFDGPDSDVDPSLHDEAHLGELSLYGDCGDPDEILNTNRRFVFVRPRKQ